MLLLDDEGRVQRLRFTSRAVWAFGVALGLIALFVLFLLFGYVGDRFTIRRLQLLVEANSPASLLPATEEPATMTEPAAPRQPLSEALVSQAAALKATLLAPERYFFSPVPRWLTRPGQWPLHGWVTSEFGRRPHPLSGGLEMHTGVDIASPIGNEVRAPAAGEVLFVGEQPGYGQVLVLRHGQGYTTRFGHLERTVVVAGQEVQEGQLIARSGNTGQTTGPHLHYEVRRFHLPVDPRPLLPEMGQTAPKL
jgi:murein DD-endopeptidase MepM/ murein hydrolase activator NlpD